MMPTQDKNKPAANVPLRKIIILAILCVIALATIFHGRLTRSRQGRDITAVQSMGPDAIAVMINCPVCTHQFSEAESAAASAPNMRNCPKCKQQIPLSYLLRQQQQGKK